MENNDIIGKKFYKFDVVNDEAILKVFTLKEKSNIYPDSVYDYYEFEESDEYKFYQTSRKNTPNLFCSKYIESEVFDDIRNAAQVIWDRYDYFEQHEHKNNGLYIKRIVQSKVFQDVLDKYPSIMI